MHVLEVLEKLSEESSRLAKVEILEENFNNEFLKRVLLAALNPYVNYGIAKFKMPPACYAYAAVVYVDQETGDQINPRDLYFKDFVDELLPKLASRELKGNAAKTALIEAFKSLDKVGQKWAKRILTQNLRAGTQTSTVNKVWSDLIPSFKVQLAYPLETSHDSGKIHIDSTVHYPIRVEPKLDGLRCIAIKRRGQVTLFTRNGRIIESLPSIKFILENAGYDDLVLDGEVMGEDWNESVSIIGSKKNKKDDSNIVFNVFDAIHANGWFVQRFDIALKQRLRRVESVVSLCPTDGPIKTIPGKIVHSERELLAFYEQSLESDFEGIMLKDLDSPYEFKRSRWTRKMKPVATYEGTIVGWYYGREGTKNHGKFGGFIVLLDNGVTTRCGNGYSDVARATMIIEGPDTHVGRVIEIGGQPPLTRDGRVRFPAFIRYRDPSDIDPKISAAYDSWLAAKDIS